MSSFEVRMIIIQDCAFDLVNCNNYNICGEFHQSDPCSPPSKIVQCQEGLPKAIGVAVVGNANESFEVCEVEIYIKG